MNSIIPILFCADKRFRQHMGLKYLKQQLRCACRSLADRARALSPKELAAQACRLFPLFAEVYASSG